MRALVTLPREPPRMHPLPLPSPAANHDLWVRPQAVALAPSNALNIRHYPLNNGQFAHAHYFAGTVLDSRHAAFKLGDRVMGFAENGLAAAEIATVASFRVQKVPQALGDLEAAAMAYDGFVGVRAMSAFERLENFVLILGADSPVGAVASAWARFALNTRVHAVCRDPAKITRLRPGPTRLVEMNRGQPWDQALSDVKYDLILDCIGGYSIWAQAKYLLRSGGTFVSIYGDMFDPPRGITHIAAEAMTNLFRNFKAAISPGSGPKYEVFNSESTPYSIQQAAQMLSDDRVSIPSFAQEYSLEQIAQYLEADTQSVRPVLNLLEKI
jgi:NADPH:quinone reductase-like Zn-dependent oxidoreductase